MQILYLHGFASSPDSTKATYLRELLQAQGHTVVVPDLNLPTFETLSIEAGLSRAALELARFSGPAAIIGSSLGGFTALELMRRKTAGFERVERIILLAPAFSFLHSKALTPEVLARWRSAGALPVYHSGSKTARAVHYDFIRGLEVLPEPLAPLVETLIFHGVHDEVIDITHSRRFAAQLPSGRLFELPTDHQLLSVLPTVGAEITKFLAPEVSGGKS